MATRSDWEFKAHLHTMGIVYAFMTGVWIVLAELAGLSLHWAVVFGVGIQIATGLYGACRGFWKANRS